MDLHLTEGQEMLRTQARKFLERECPKSLVREMEDREKVHSPELWRKMSELGWMGLVLPEEYGGSGGTFLDLTVLLEEMGRVLLPAPFLSTVVLGALPILTAGSKEQKSEFLPKVAKGALILTATLMEPSARYDAAGVAVRAVPDKDGYAINGTKLFVPYAPIADYMLCPTRTGDNAGSEDGITIFLISGGSKGVLSSLVDTIGSDKQYEVTFDGTRVSKSNVIGQVNQGWEIMKSILEQAAVAQCAMMVGGAQQVLEMATKYAKDRIQFDRPIGSFQAIQHKCANMMIDVYAARYVTYKAAWKISEGFPSPMEASMAKSWVNEAYRRVCVEGHQIHGAIGFTRDHDMGLYYRRAKAAELAFGDSDFHREIVAHQLDSDYEYV
jgi:alkylation response protein AidB-like acyl-CoA dehydrogenase